MRRFAAIAALVSALFGPSLANAGPYTDDLSKCIVKFAAPDDQLMFIKWLFSAMALHPGVQDLAAVTDQQRDEFNRRAAGLFTRLMTADCRQQTIDAIKYEGSTAIETSFRLLGEVAMRGLMSNPRVAEGTNKLGTYFAEDQNLVSVLREAGVPDPGKSK